jgi:hypothetical protein
MAELQKGGFYELNHDFLWSAYRAVHHRAPLVAAQETKDRRIRKSKNVSILRVNHISTESALLGVWRGKRLPAVVCPDCEQLDS